MEYIATRAETLPFSSNRVQRKLTKKSSDSRGLAHSFGDYFQVISADTPELLESVYRLRYQVYCEETGFEDPAQYPDQLEKDGFDDYSVHSLIRHRKTGIYMGTVRLILPRTDLNQCFPIQKVATHPIFFERELVPRSQVTEISRFALSKNFKKQLLEFSPQSATIEEHQLLPHLILGLFLGMVRMSVQHGITHWFCVMEPALVRLLSRYELHFTPYGPTVEYHGKRQPCYAYIDEFLARARKSRPDVWELITDGGRLWPSSESQRDSQVIRFPHSVAPSQLKAIA